MRISDWSSDVCSSDLARGAWVAFAVAQTLEVTLNVADGGRANGFHDHLGRLLGIEVAQWWRPTAENFFGRVKKDIMLEALVDIGGPVLRGRYKDAKKTELANACASLCNGRGIVEAEIREKRSEEHTSELQSLMRISYAVFGLQKKQN